MDSPETVQKIYSDKYPDFRIKIGDRFAFRPPNTIILGPVESHYSLLALHELGHALCKHYNFTTHVDRLKKEREAWDKAHTICTEFGVEWDENFVQSQLDTYRDWLHTKSKCKKCGLTRYQTRDGHYHCPYCETLS